MAETAALNGFNRILAELNNNDGNDYKGYLYTLDHHSGDPNIVGDERWGWKQVNQKDFPLKELCTDRSKITKAVPANGTTEEAPLVDLTDEGSTQRDDGKANIKLQYRMRLNKLELTDLVKAVFKLKVLSSERMKIQKQIISPEHYYSGHSIYNQSWPEKETGVF